MTRPIFPPRVGVRTRRDAFTLIELLTVIAIILILAGLLLHVAGSANYRTTFARAATEVQAMSTALESYRADNGAYPRNASTDGLNAQGSSGTPPDPSTYTSASQYLFQTLSGYGSSPNGTFVSKPYMTFIPGQLSTGNATPTSSTYIVDPFGLAYGYSTINAAAQDAFNTSGTPIPTTAGYNPTFDLWSTGGYANSGGRTYPASVTTANQSTLWAKNW